MTTFPRTQTLQLDTKTRTELRASHAGETEQKHLALFEARLTQFRGSMLLLLWMMAGFITGALPALLGRDWVYYTIYRVESFVDAHYAEQIRLLAAQHCPHTDVIELFQHCREEEIEHKDEALSAMASAPGSALKIWGWLVGKGSQIAVFFAKRV